MNWNSESDMRPCRSVEKIRAALADARATGMAVVPRGAGFSQGATSIGRGIMLDLTPMNEVRIDEKEAKAIVEPGATVDQLWRTAMTKGYWPEFLPTTPSATLGGCLAMNAYNTRRNGGAIGEYAYDFDLLRPSGGLLKEVSKYQSNNDLFYAVMGSMGMLGVVTRISFRLHPIVSGLMKVQQEPVESFEDLFGRPGEFGRFEKIDPPPDYVIAWINPDPQRTKGFGSILRGNFEDDPASVHPVRQRSWQGLLPTLRSRAKGYPFNNHPCPEKMPIEEFHFFSPLGSLLHHPLRNMTRQQCLFFRAVVRALDASAVASQLLQLSHNAHLIPLWCNIKQHWPVSFSRAPFSLVSRVRGYLLELVYDVTLHNEAAVRQLLRKLADVVINAGGEISLDDSNALPAEIYARSLGKERINEFLELKNEYDEDMLFQSDLFRELSDNN